MLTKSSFSASRQIRRMKKPNLMKKLILTGTLGVFFLGMTSCGGHVVCDAYKKADYTKYKTEHTNKVLPGINFKKGNK